MLKSSSSSITTQIAVHLAKNSDFAHLAILLLVSRVRSVPLLTPRPANVPSNVEPMKSYKLMENADALVHSKMASVWPNVRMSTTLQLS